MATLYVGLVAASGALYWLGANSPGIWAGTLVLPWSVIAFLVGFRFPAPIGGVVAVVLFLGGVGINTWGVYALTKCLTRGFRGFRGDSGDIILIFDALTGARSPSQP